VATSVIGAGSIAAFNYEGSPDYAVDTSQEPASGLRNGSG